METCLVYHHTPKSGMVIATLTMYLKKVLFIIDDASIKNGK